MFGDTEEMLPTFVSYVKKGGYIAVAFPARHSNFNFNKEKSIEKATGFVKLEIINNKMLARSY